jgi:tyrosinase
MSDKSTVSRRGLVAGGIALAAASTLPKVPARAQAPARWRRYNVASPQGQQMLAYYKTAMDNMLRLPPSDPRNWYRLAFQHYLDCPHGNWWLFPWHRGFTGWAEQIVRRFSGNDSFAFPYWDWTANPEVPVAMRGQGFFPSGPPFLPNVAAFQAAFQGVLANSGYWQGPQLKELQARSLPSNAALWDQITNPLNPQWPSFFPASGGGKNYPNVRNPNPGFDCRTAKAVSAQTLAQAMAAQDYATFSSPPTTQHSAVAGFAILEGQPHNNVHNNVGGIVYQQQGAQCGPNFSNTGGIMQAFLSPSDPLFYLHHSNIDRLWDAWTRQQIAAGRTNYQPQGTAFTRWAQEPFLFFVDANGAPVTQNQAGYYARIGQFNYDYQPGSAGQSSPLLGIRRRPRVRRFPGERPRPAPAAAPGGGSRVAVRLQPALLQLAGAGSGQQLLAKVTVRLPMLERGQVVRILVDTGAPGEAVEAGTISLFGHGMVHGPLAVTVGLADALAALGRRNALRPNGYLYFRAVVADGGKAEGGQQFTAQRELDVPVDAVVVEAH